MKQPTILLMCFTAVLFFSCTSEPNHEAPVIEMPTVHVLEWSNCLT